MSMNPPIGRLYRAGQAREVQPACGALRRTLRTSAHVAAAPDDQSLKVCAVPISLYDDIEVIGEPGLACWAGWESVIHRLLVADGYQVETIGSPRRSLPRPDFGHFQRLGLVDHALLDCMCQQERALIRYAGEYVDPVQLIAQIALAWPKQRIAVIAIRIDEGRHIRDRLRGYGSGFSIGNASSYCVCNSRPSSCSRKRLSTFTLKRWTRHCWPSRQTGVRG